MQIDKEGNFCPFLQLRSSFKQAFGKKKSTKPLDQQDMVKGTGQGSSTLRYLWAWPLLLATGEHKASSARKEVSAEVGPAYHP